VNGPCSAVNMLGNGVASKYNIIINKDYEDYKL
jgi:hypothetical protein